MPVARAFAVVTAVTLATQAAALSVIDLFSPATPKCASREATDLVKQISVRDLRPVLSDLVTHLTSTPTTTDEAETLASLSVTRIKTIDQTDDGSYSCEARLRIGARGADQILGFEIEYTVEPPEDGEFYVTVGGLQEIIEAVELDRAAGNL